LKTRKHVHEEFFRVTPERLFALLHTPSAIRGEAHTARQAFLRAKTDTPITQARSCTWSDSRRRTAPSWRCDPGRAAPYREDTARPNG
jgi:hypothetical protein